MRRKCVWAGVVTMCLFCALCLQAQQADSNSSDNTAPSVASQPASGSIPRLIKFSGAVKDLTGKVPVGSVGLTFALYEFPEGGRPLWVETQSVLLDAQGHYTALLGATSPDGLPQDLFTSSRALWLGVQPQLPGQAELPRVLLVAVPYALKAADADTLGGLPPAAFLQAQAATASTAANLLSAATTKERGAAKPQDTNVCLSMTSVAGGLTNMVGKFDAACDLQSSAIFESGGNVGIGTTVPAGTLDVNGSALIRGSLQLPPTGTADATQGFNSQPHDFVASSFNSNSVSAVSQLFQWQAEPLGSGTSSPSAKLSLLFASGNGTPAETGLSIGPDGVITFAANQTFAGGITGTITQVTAGSGLTGGGSSGNVTLNLDTSKVPTLGAASNAFAGGIAAGSFTGSGVGLTNLNASNLSTGTVPASVLSGTYNVNISGNALTATSAVTALTATSTDISGSGFTVGAMYSVHGSSGLALAEANTSSSIPALCFATSSTTCAVSGTYTTSGLTAGAVYYLSDSVAGAITPTPPSTSGHYVQRIGVAVSSTVLAIQVSLDVATIQ